MTSEFNHGYAVVISIDKNQVARLALPSVEKDVQALYDVLIHPERCAYKAENVKLLKGEASTQRNIIDALVWLQDKVKGDAEATAVIYYSGHGMVDTNTDLYYLIPYDIRALSSIRSDAIRADTLTAEISSVQAKRLLVVLDCCHAAGMDIKDVDLSEGAPVKGEAFPLELPGIKSVPEYEGEPGSKDVADLSEGEGRAILNSSTGAQKSYVRPDGKMSLFTYHLIEALTGHAPHPDDATVVYVTDVMSWVTHQVKKSATSIGVSQTPVMRTSGVFPVAQLIGGKGVVVSKGDVAPDPLEPLPAAGVTTTIHQEGQTVQGHQANIGQMQGNIGQIGDNVNTEGGAFVRGNVTAGRDFVGRDQTTIGRDQISVGDISGSSGVAIGAGASSSVTHGDTFDMSGNFQGANVNVKSTLTNVTQTIGAMPHVGVSEKQQLETLLAQLNTMLQSVPPAKVEAANEIAEATKELVSTAAAEKPSKTMVKMIGEGLKQAAQSLKNELPEIVDLVTQIVTLVAAVAGLAR